MTPLNISIDKEIKKMCSKAKEAWLDGQCKEIERTKTTDSKYMHSKISDIAGKRSSSQSGCIKSKHGDVLMDRTDTLNKWAEYTEDLFYDNRGNEPEITKSIEGPVILEAEVEKTIREIGKGKAVGPDSIPVETYEALDKMGIKKLTTLFNDIYVTGNILGHAYLPIHHTPQETGDNRL